VCFCVLGGGVGACVLGVCYLLILAGESDCGCNVTLLWSRDLNRAIGLFSRNTEHFILWYLDKYWARYVFYK
jgi:hypothetical protein